MGLFKNFDRKKWLYNGLIITFIFLYAATAFVSFYHAITFFNIANAIWLSVILSFVAEIGQASVLFSILLTENKNKILSWFIMIILTTLQVIGNVVSSFDWILAHNDAGVDGFKRAILFSVQTTDPEMFRVIIAWISGALLPVIALSMTALVAQNLKLRDDEKNDKNLILPTGSTISQIPVMDAKDIISEVSKFRPTEEDIEKMERFLKNKTPINKVPTEEEETSELDKLIKESKSTNGGVPFDDPIIDIIHEKTQSPPDFVDPIDEPEEPIEPDDEFGPIDLTNDIPDKILKETDHLDEEVTRLTPEINISHTNGLVDGINIPVKTEKEDKNIIEEPPIIQLEKKVEETPSPTLEVKTISSPLTPEQLERIRQIARDKDNLKKK